jgi:hypothetical protein
VYAACETLGAAGLSVTSKSNKHRAIAEKVGACFVPFVVESFGGFSKHANSLVKLVSSFAEDQNPMVKKSLFRKKFVSELANSIQFGNFLITAKGIRQSSLCHPLPFSSPSHTRYIDSLTMNWAHGGRKRKKSRSKTTKLAKGVSSPPCVHATPLSTNLNKQSVSLEEKNQMQILDVASDVGAQGTTV